MLSVIVISLFVQNQLALAGDLHPVDRSVVGNKNLALATEKVSRLSTIRWVRSTGAAACGDRSLSVSFGITVLPVRKPQTRLPPRPLSLPLFI
ncbi:hypothetical protein ACVI3U_001246 [Sinorhizobium medicae]